jgi:ribosomal protein S18 acetylase RimI-like enzyme
VSEDVGDELQIRSVRHGDETQFFAYLDDHLSDNGKNGTALFQPLSATDSRFPADKRIAFSSGLATPYGQPGWRHAWIALDAHNAIAGHVDLRARPERYTGHRALLGMGVHRDHRREGLGLRLIHVAIGWARSCTAIEHIDLEVLSSNAAALALYQKAGFHKIGEYEDMFRIDGASLSYTLMTASLVR